jgi:hypothetical protein
MEISRTAIGVLAAVCIGAGAGTAYFAGRSTGEMAPRDSVAVEQPAVEQSESVVADEAPEPVALDAPPAPYGESKTAAAAPRVPARPQPRPRPAREADAAPPAPAPLPVSRPEPLPALEPAPLVEAPRPLEPVGPQFDELVVSADSVVGLQLESSVSSERARVEDEVLARVTRDVRVGDRVAIPAGSRAEGEVTLVERGGRLKERARLGVRFTSIVLADGTRLPIQTETILREGDAPGNESAAKIGGGAIGGAIIGGILGGSKGAAIGGAVGAGAGSGAVLAGGRNPATLSAGSPVTVRLDEPVTVTVER